MESADVPRGKHAKLKFLWTDKQASRMECMFFCCVFFLMWPTSMTDPSQEESKFMEVTQTNQASVNSPDFTVLSNLNGCAPLHLFYWPFKLLGFQLKRRFISLRPDLPLIYTT